MDTIVAVQAGVSAEVKREDSPVVFWRIRVYNRAPRLGSHVNAVVHSLMMGWYDQVGNAMVHAVVMTPGDS